MSKKITIVSTCKMGPGTFEAKFEPLSKVESVEKIIVVRKIKGPEIAKVEYVVLPRCCANKLINALVTPLIVCWQVRKHKADLILAYHYVPHYYIAFIASILTGIPYVLGQTGRDDQLLALHRITGWFLRKVIRGALRLNVPGNSSAQFWRSLGFKNVEILHSSIDTDYYYPADTGKEFDFIYIGRLEGYKGTFKIIRALHKLSSKYPLVKCAIVGYGSQEEFLKKTAADLGIDDCVVFTGFQADTRSWLHKARIFVIASDTEGLPCALMEAMSCGLLCISSLVGNIGDVILDGNTGFGFQPQDQDRLEYLMDQTYQNEIDLKDMKIAARELIVSSHSHRDVIQKWEKLFEELQK